MFDIHNAKLGEHFYCHAQTPSFGFWGELRDMVRQDMNIAEAIQHHCKTWGFTGAPPLLISKEHDMSHIILAVSCIYMDELKALLPTVNPARPSFLKPQGYNGFIKGESLAVFVEVYLQSMCSYSHEESMAKGFQRIEEFKEMNFFPETQSWYLASLREQPTSIIEVKKEFGWDYEAIEECFESQFRQMQQRQRAIDSSRNAQNRHGERNPLLEVADSLLAESFVQKLGNVFETFKALKEQRFGNDGSFNQDEVYGLWANVKIRDLHRMIGGKEAANAYFELCSPSPKSLTIKKATADLVVAL